MWLHTVRLSEKKYIKVMYVKNDATYVRSAKFGSCGPPSATLPIGNATHLLLKLSGEVLIGENLLDFGYNNIT